MNPGDQYVRMRAREYTLSPERVGDRIRIEECPLPQTGAPDQARAVFIEGNREGEKVQWAICYIEGSDWSKEENE